MEKSNNGKVFLGFVIGVLAMAVVGMAGYIIYDKNNSKVNDNNQLENNNGNNNIEEDNKITELSLEDEFVKKVFKMHSGFIYKSNYVDMFYGNNNMIFINLPKGMIEVFFIWDWLSDVPETSRDDSYVYYNSTTILNEWKKLVGPNMEFDLYNDGGDHDGYKFDSDGSFKKCLGCGGNTGPLETTNTLLRATKTDDEIVLYEAVKFMELGNSDYDELWYKDYNKTIPITKDEEMDANYKFIYKKDANDNYYFYGVEKIN